MANRRKYSLVSRITLFLCASFAVKVQLASVTKTGQLNACNGPCTDYAIVITARVDQIVMKIYKINRHKGNSITTPSDIQQLKVNPGSIPMEITKLARSPKDIDSILNTLVTAAKKEIPKEFLSGTPLFFLCSVTMEDTDDFAFGKVLMRVKKFMKDTKKNPFLPPSSNSLGKINGFAEMMYRWLAANFLAGNLLPSNRNLANNMGLINMNSNLMSQIIFPVYNMDSNATEFVSVGGDTILLAAGSFTENGLNQGLRLYIQSLTKGKPFKKSQSSTASYSHLDIPTLMEVLSDKEIPSDMDVKGSAFMNTDTMTTRRVEHIGGLPNDPSTASKIITSPCSPPGIQLHVTDSGKEYNMTGTGNVDKCRKVIQKVILEKYDAPSQSPYMITPRRSVIFYALKEIVPVVEKFGCHDCKRTFNVAKIDAAVRKYCSGKTPSTDMPASTTGCLNGNFFYTMLTRAYHFDRFTPITVLKASQDHIEEDWSLGAVLHKMQLLRSYTNNDITSGSSKPGPEGIMGR